MSIDPTVNHVLNRKELEQSINCGCIYCLKIFPIGEIKEWVDGGMTAICPHCLVDSLVGDTQMELNTENLQPLHNYWF